MRTRCLLSIGSVIGLIANIALADQYILVMSKDDEVCQPMLKLYNDDLREHGKIILENHKEFNWIKWNNIKYIHENTQKTYKDDNFFQIANFDINNDGKEDTVIRAFSNNRLFTDFYDVNDIGESTFPYPAIFLFIESDIYKELINKTVVYEKFMNKIGGYSSKGEIRGYLFNSYSHLDLSWLDKYIKPSLQVLLDTNGSLLSRQDDYRNLQVDHYFYPIKINGRYYVVRFASHIDKFKKKPLKPNYSGLIFIYEFDNKEYYANTLTMIEQPVCLFMK